MEGLRASSLELTPTTEHSATATVPTPASTQAPSKRRSAAIIACITCITGISNLLAGLLTVCIPVIAQDLAIPPGLELWPASAFALSCGCSLLFCATVADLAGCRRVCLVGALLQACSAVGAGLTNTSTQLIALRTLAGIAASLCLPSAVGVASNAFPSATMPRSRAVAFSAMGGGQAVGFGFGLALGGVFSDTVGWRWGFHTTAALNLLVLALAAWSLPVHLDGPLDRAILAHLRQRLDWIGVMIISISLACLSYVLAVVSGPGASGRLRGPLNLSLLCVGLVLLPTFIVWVHFQTSRQKPALIPNSLWTNVPFSSVCAAVFLIWGALNASEQLAALYLQEIRGFSTLTASLYFLPAPLCGLIMNIVVALILPKLRPSIAVPAACFVSGLAPLLLAVLCRVDGPGYWHGIFQAIAMNPLGADLMYTIAMLVVTDAFPVEMQALSGGVFNMLAQIGKSVGISTTALIAKRITDQTDGVDTDTSLLRGYAAGWWYNSALGFASVLVTLWGLRRVGKLGVKND